MHWYCCENTHNWLNLYADCDHCEFFGYPCIVIVCCSVLFLTKSQSAGKIDARYIYHKRKQVSILVCEKIRIGALFSEMLRFTRKCSRMLDFNIHFLVIHLVKYDSEFNDINTAGSVTATSAGLFPFPAISALNKFTGLVRRCVEDYKMIADGETIAVGVSGGKDSIALLCALATLRGYYPQRFELHAVTLDMGFGGMDFSPVVELCRKLMIPYTLRRTDLARVIFEERNEKNPCSLCAKMRRGALHDLIKEFGISKLALAHHFDDAIETFLLSLLYEGRISCFQPVTYMDRSDVTQIRPMLYIGEGTVSRLVEKNCLPVVHNTCPMNGVSKREEVKTLIKTLSVSYPDLRSKIFGAMQRLPLDGWEPTEYAKRPLP